MCVCRDVIPRKETNRAGNGRNRSRECYAAKAKLLLRAFPFYNSCESLANIIAPEIHGIHGRNRDERSSDPSGESLSRHYQSCLEGNPFEILYPDAFFA